MYRSAPKNKDLLPDVIGASIGTLFISLLDSLPGSLSIKPTLLVSAPSFTVITSYLSTKIAFYLQNKRAEKYRKKLKYIIKVASKNSFAGEEYVESLKRKYLEIEKSQIESLELRIKDLEESIRELS